MESAIRPDLIRSVHAYMDSLIRDLPSESALAAAHTLSFRFRRRMRRLVRYARRLESGPGREPMRRAEIQTRSHSVRRKRLVILVVILTILTMAITVSANREAIGRFVVQVYEKFSTIIFSSTPTSADPSSGTDDPGSITDHLPTDLPDGYSLAEQTSTFNCLRMIYVNEAGQNLLFVKGIKSGLRIDIDTEGIQTESFLIGEYQGIYYFNKGMGGLIWEDDLYGYSIIGEITKEETLNMAISTK